MLERGLAAAQQADVVAKKKMPANQRIRELRAKLAPMLRSTRRKLRNAPRVLTDSKKELVETLNNVIDQISKVKP